MIPVLDTARATLIEQNRLRELGLAQLLTYGEKYRLKVARPAAHHQPHYTAIYRPLLVIGRRNFVGDPPDVYLGVRTTQQQTFGEYYAPTTYIPLERITEVRSFNHRLLWSRDG